MTHVRATAVLVTLAALAAPPSAQGLQRDPLGPRSDFYFEELADGNILAADAKGTHLFTSWYEYARSGFFQEHGARCGADRVPLPLGFGSTTDCNTSNTNPAPQYDPASGPDYVIPIVFHIIERTDGTGAVADSLVFEQVDVLNEDFGAFGGGALGTNTRIQFMLAGITHSVNNTWYADGGSYYNTLAWDPHHYLNVYSNNANGFLGYSFIPSGGGVAGNLSDRVVILWSTIGDPAPYGPPYHLGRTATHEIGHYLGLYHTFQGGCTSPASCHNNGDLICDTNPESSPNFSPCGRTTCSSVDPTDNYLDYSDDICMTMFTSEQAHRMRCTLQNFRADLTLNLPSAATAPSPANNEGDVSVNVQLGWTAGSGATSHDVYFGTDPGLGGGSFQGNQAGTTFDPGTLSTGLVYYWRIDEVNSSGTTTGSLWKFTTEAPVAPPAQAASPLPMDGALHIHRNIQLHWTAGAGTSSHDVYFGTVDPPPFVGNRVQATFDPGRLDLNQTYYWRIDEVNGLGTTAGNVWSFTTDHNVARKKL